MCFSRLLVSLVTARGGVVGTRSCSTQEISAARRKSKVSKSWAVVRAGRRAKYQGVAHAMRRKMSFTAKMGWYTWARRPGALKIEQVALANFSPFGTLDVHLAVGAAHTLVGGGICAVKSSEFCR